MKQLEIWLKVSINNVIIINSHPKLAIEKYTHGVQLVKIITHYKEKYQNLKNIKKKMDKKRLIFESEYDKMNSDYNKLKIQFEHGSRLV